MKNFAFIFAAALLLSSCGYLKTENSHSSNSSRVSDGNPEKSISTSLSTMNRVQADNVSAVRSAAEAARQNNQ